MTDQTDQRKPYVGPNPIQNKDHFFGRERETIELIVRLKANHTVLLHSPSGAGKSSLIQAGLIPGLSGQDYCILPTIRVNRLPDPGILSAESGYNRYLLSALSSLDQGLAMSEQAAPEELAAASLADYLKANQGKFASRSGGPLIRRFLLIFDQFEEILTIDPGDKAGKEAFFGDLLNALVDTRYWAVFAMREDYLARLEPYLSYFPDRLSAHFRLEFLEPPQALQAIQEPVKRFGVRFNDDAASQLVKDLRQVYSLTAQGQIDKQPGPFIEPVQLQVVCSNLWEAPRPDPGQITLADVQRWGDVDNALANYYCDRVSETVNLTGVAERSLREWIRTKLITHQGLRNQVLSGPDPEYGIDDAVIDSLVDAYLVREDQRRGATWLELAHDRLVEPVRRNNAEWFEKHLNPLQRQAVLWEREDRPDRLLLRDQALVEAEAFAGSGALLNKTEETLLRESQELRADIEQEKRQQAERLESQRLAAARFRRLFAAAAVVAVIAIISAGLAAFLKREADLSKAAALAAESQALANEATAIAEGRRADAQKSTAEAASIQAISAAAAAEIARQEADLQRVAAEASARIARAGELAALALAQQDQTLDRSLLLGVEAHRTADINRTRDALLRNLEYSPRLEHFLLGTTSGFGFVALSPDGRILAMGDEDGSIRLVDVANGRLFGQPLMGDGAGVASLDFSPDGKILASIGSDNTLSLWDVSDPGEPQLASQPLQGDSAWISGLAFSSDGEMLASLSSNSTIRLWDISDPRQPQPLGQSDWNQMDTLVSLAISPDGGTLATGNNIGQVLLWDISNPRDPQPFVRKSVETAQVDRLAFNPDGKQLALGGRDGTVIVWDIADPSNPQTIGEPFQGSDGALYSLEFSPDGQVLAAGGGDGFITLWQGARELAPLTSLPGHRSAVFNLIFSPDGETLLSTAYDRAVIQWDLTADSPLSTPLEGDGQWISTVAFSPDGQNLASGASSGEVTLWDTASQRAIDGPLEGHTDFIRKVAYSPDGKNLASASDDGTIILWDVASRTPVGQPLLVGAGAAMSLAFSPDGQTLASGDEDGALQLWDVKSQQPTGSPMRESGTAIHSLAFSPEGQILVTGSEDGTIVFWDVASQKQRGLPLQGHTDYVRSLAFSPDGKILASGAGSDDGSVILWDVTNQKRSGLPLDGNSVAFSPDGRTLATGDISGFVTLWDLVSRQPIGWPLEGQDITSVAFSPDGKSVAAGSGEGPILLLDVDPASWAQRACQVAGRNLTQAEWAEFFPGEPYRRTCPQWPAGE